MIFGAIVLAACIFGTSSIEAQQYLATLTGTVSDATGAKIPNASVTAKETRTNFVTKAVSNAAGSYSIPFLAPGTYDVSISAPGFGGQVKTNIVLSAGGNTQADFVLQVGAATTSVQVTADQELLETGTANLGQVLDSKEVADTPNIGRNPFILSTLSPGVVTGAFMQSKASAYTQPYSGVAVQLTVNGNYGHQRLTLNGIPDDPPERFSGSDYTGFVPSPEAVQEVKTQTALYDAQYGHGNGTVINTVLKSGSNQYHGAAYYIFQNTYLNSNSYERSGNHQVRPNDQWNQPGFVLDGPVSIPHVYNGHDKTFFMVAYERIQTHTPVQYTGTVPTAAERNGDFSGLVQANGQPITIYDPLTEDANHNRTAFAGNIIPAGRMNSAGMALLKYYPAPNAPGNAQGYYNYIATDVSSPDRYNSLAVRIDHAFSDANKLNATYLWSVRNQLYTKEGFPFVGPSGFGYHHFRNNYGGSLDWVSVLSPTLVLDARIGGIYHPFQVAYYGSTFDLSKLGISSTGLPVQSFPGVSMSDSYTGLQAGSGTQYSESTVGSTSVMISKSFQKHTVRTGIEAQVLRYNVASPVSGLGTFSFNRQFTQKNAIDTPVGGDAASGNPIASLLLGYPSGGSYSTNIASAIQQLYYAAYVQDDWRITRNLTVNLGLRWDYEAPLTERYNRQNAGFCITCTNPLQASVPGLTLKGGLLFTSSSHRYPFKRDLNNFQPRIGVAYQLNSKMVVRAGFGIIYFDTIDTTGAAGFNASTSYVATTDGSHPVNSIDNPFPSGVIAPSGSSLGLATQVGQSVSFTNTDRVVPKLYQYSANLQTQLPGNMVMEIGFVGSSSRQLEVGKSINSLSAQYYSLGAAYLQGTVANPFAGQVPGSSLNAATIQRQYLLTPYPEFTGVTEYNNSLGSSDYTAMQDSLTKRMSHGLTLHANFTWAKVMSKDTYLNGQDSFNQLYRYENNQPNILFNLVGSYQIPTLLSHNVWQRLLFQGWQLNSVVRWQNGFLISNPGGVTLLGSARLGNSTYKRFFNNCYLDTKGVRHNCTSLSELPAFQQNPSFTLNTTGPTMSGVRGRVHPLTDASLFKVFQIHDKYNFEIRGEFFNVFNTVNFGNPNTSLTSSQFGVVALNQANDPRIGQLTARFNF
ncbi:MAG: TonB-dependent receptor [Acidobacteriaceae bacterium]